MENSIIEVTPYGTLPTVHTKTNKNWEKSFSRCQKLILFGASLTVIFLLSANWKYVSPSENYATTISAYTTDLCQDISSGPKLDCCSSTDQPAFGGLDVVYLYEMESHGRPLVGSVSFSLTMAAGGSTAYTFYFLSQDHKDKFEADPDAYLPMYGGFDAWGLANGEDEGEGGADYLSSMEDLGGSIDTVYWDKLDDGKVYFFGSVAARMRFRANSEKYTELGNQAWQRLVADDAVDTDKISNGVVVNTNCFRGTPVDRLDLNTAEWDPLSH